MIGGDPEDRIATLVDRHGLALLRVARQHSLCADDAQDAYQRALEIYLRRLATVDPATEAGWMKVVVRHEAMAVRRLRSESVAGDDVDFDAHVDEGVRSLDERLAAAERSARSAEVLRRLKPDEAKALMLKAEGRSYAEIAEQEGWTYTKVNRAITEGRRRFLKTYADLETGDGCSAFAAGLRDLVQGTASAEALVALRPHLRHCPACRATVRELRGGRRRAAAWLPVPVLLAGLSRRAPGEPLSYEANLAEIGGSVPVLVEPPVVVSPGRWAEVKLHFQNLLHRFSGSDVATSAQLAAGSGGGRVTTIAALIGVCISGVGAGTYCVATLVLPEPAEKPAARKAADRPKPMRRPVERPAATVTAVRRTPIIRIERTPTTTPRPVRRQPKRTPKPKASSTSHEKSTPAAPVVPGQQELSFEQSQPPANTKPQPAAPPATGGDEFSP